MKGNLIPALGLSVFLSACGGGGGGDAIGSSTGDTGIETDLVTPATTVQPETGTQAEGDDLGAISVSIIGPQELSRGGVAALAADTNAGALAEYEWTLIAEPEGAVTATAVTGSTALLAAGSAGEYGVQLIVSEGDEISEPAFIRFNSVDNGPQPGRTPIPGELEFQTTLAIEDIQRKLTSPSTFALRDAPQFVQDDNPALGFIVILFSAQNGFGITLDSSAVCAVDWSGYVWSNILGPDLDLCIIL